MNICVCVQFNSAFKQVADITLPVLREYCVRHGYALRVDEDARIKRSIIWDRYAIIREQLELFQWVAHFDADVLVTNLNIRLEDFMSPVYGEAPYVIMAECATEKGDLDFNDGVCFFRSNTVTKNIVEDIILTPDSATVLCGQDAFSQMYENTLPLECVRVARQKDFNSFLYTEYGMPETTVGNWTPGDFVLHLPGCSNARRVEIFSEKLKEVLR